MPYSPMGAQPLGFAPWQPFGVYPWQAYVQPGDGHWSTPGLHWVAAPSATLGRVEPSATHSAVPQPLGGVYGLGSSIESHPIPPPSLHDGEGSSFPRFGAIKWCVQFWFCYECSTRWFWCGDLVSGWWVYSHLVCRAVCGLLPHLSWVHWQGVIVNPFSPGNLHMVAAPYFCYVLCTIVQLYKEDWGILCMLGCRACSPEQ